MRWPNDEGCPPWYWRFRVVLDLVKFGIWVCWEALRRNIL